MVTREEGLAAAGSMRTLIVGLAEQLLELVAAAWPDELEEEVGRFRRLAELGRDVALGGDAAGMAILRADRADGPGQGGEA